MRLIRINENQCVVKEKITYYGIPQDNPTQLVIWLDGEGVITNNYPDAQTAKEEFVRLNKIMED